MEEIISDVLTLRRRVQVKARIESRHRRVSETLELLRDFVAGFEPDRRPLHEAVVIMAYRRKIHIDVEHPDTLLMRMLNVGGSETKVRAATAWARAVNSVLRSGKTVDEALEAAGGFHKLAWPSSEMVDANAWLRTRDQRRY